MFKEIFRPVYPLVVFDVSFATDAGEIKLNCGRENVTERSGSSRLKLGVSNACFRSCADFSPWNTLSQKKC